MKHLDDNQWALLTSTVEAVFPLAITRNLNSLSICKTYVSMAFIAQGAELTDKIIENIQRSINKNARTFSVVITRNEDDSQQMDIKATKFDMQLYREAMDAWREEKAEAKRKFLSKL